LLVADAELYRLDAIVRWLDAAESRIRRLPPVEERPAPPVRLLRRPRVGSAR
jgi:hypothetical protein